MDVIYPLYGRVVVHQRPSWTPGSGNVMCDSCVQPVVSSILKRSIKKRWMVVRLMTAWRGERGRENRRAQASITGASVEGKRGRQESIVISHKAHLSFTAERGPAVPLPTWCRGQSVNGGLGRQR